MATDNFNRADASPAGGNWSTAPGFTGLQVVSSTCAKIDSFGGDAVGYWNAASFANNQYSQVVASTLGTNSDWGPAARITTGGTTKNCYVASSYSPAEEIFKFVGGSYTSLASITTSNVVVGDIVRVECEGTTIRWVKNGVSQGSTTDSSLASGAAGIFFYVPDARVDDWEGGDIGGAVIATTRRRTTVLIPGPGPYNPAQFMRRRGSTTVMVSGITADANITQAGNTLAATCAVDVQAAANITQAGNTTTSTAAVLVQADANITQAGNTTASTAAVLIQAAANITQAGNTVTAAASTGGITADANITQAGNTLAATCAVDVQAAANITQAGNTTTSTAAVLVQADANITQAGNTVTATASVGADQSRLIARPRLRPMLAAERMVYPALPGRINIRPSLSGAVSTNV